VNDESLGRANAFLSAVAGRVEVGEILRETPAEIGRELGLPDALSTARAVRALIARRRLEPANGSYRLLDVRPVESGERETIGRRPRKSRRPATARAGRPRGDAHAYSDLGRAVADKLVDLGRENAELRAELRQAREELRAARAARDDADRRARGLGERSKELEARADMAESNLRSLLATARGTGQRPDAAVGDSEMEAILGVLKGGEGAAEEGGESTSAETPSESVAAEHSVDPASSQG
jgi:hypothetical protein